jgi:hypothetical protein
MTIQDTQDISNFILLCSNSYQVFRFVCTLRSVHLTTSELKPIVIMCPTPPSESEFRKLAMFPLVYFFVGDPSKTSHLLHAGVLRADRIVLTNLADTKLKKSNKDYSESTIESEAVNDSGTIMISNLIHKICEEAGTRKHIVTDLRIRN